MSFKDGNLREQVKELQDENDLLREVLEVIVPRCIFCGDMCDLEIIDARAQEILEAAGIEVPRP